MKHIKLLYFMLLTVALSSCFEDETTNATRPISEITIEDGQGQFPIQSVYNIENAYILKIEPQITQSNEQKPLYYRWEVENEVVSTEPIYEFEAVKLGTFQCRLIVGNEDGRSFFPFTINVNTKYEEGLTVISKDADGKSHLSFMLTPTDGSERKFYDYDCFKDANPDIDFADNVIDVAKCGKNLVIACQGNVQTGESPTLYFLNDKTFVWENILKVSPTEFPDFKPVRLALPLYTIAGPTYPILCENGKVYDVSVEEGMVSKPRQLLAEYSQSCVINSRSQGAFELIFWDKDIKALTEIYNGNGPIYCSQNEYPLYDRNICAAGENYFAGTEDFISMVLINKTREQLKEQKPEILVFTKYLKFGSVPCIRQTVLASTFFVLSTDNTSVFQGSYTDFMLNGQVPFDETTPCIANETYSTLLFANGNKVMYWNFESGTSPTTAFEFLTVGTSPDANITSFEISADHKKTYVAFWEPSSTEERKGSVWVIDTDTGDVLEQYNNKFYEPVKMIYKVK